VQEGRRQALEPGMALAAATNRQSEGGGAEPRGREGERGSEGPCRWTMPAADTCAAGLPLCSSTPSERTGRSAEKASNRSAMKWAETRTDPRTDHDACSPDPTVVGLAGDVALSGTRGLVRESFEEIIFKYKF